MAVRKPKYEVGQFVFLKTDPDQLERSSYLYYGLRSIVSVFTCLRNRANESL